MEKCSVFLRGERHWYFTGILNYCVPDRLWCLEVASTGPMISCKQGDCDCLAKSRYNNNQDLPPWFLCLLPVLYPAGAVSRTLIQTEIHSPSIRAVILTPGLFRGRYPADTDTLCRSWKQLCSGSWASAEVRGHQPHFPFHLEWDGCLAGGKRAGIADFCCAFWH